VVLRLFLFDVIGLNSADFSIPLFSLTRVDPFMVDFECADFHSFVRLYYCPMDSYVLGSYNTLFSCVAVDMAVGMHGGILFHLILVCEAVESPGGLQDCQGGVEGD